MDGLDQLREWAVAVGTIGATVAAATGLLVDLRGRRLQQARLVFVLTSRFVFSTTDTGSDPEAMISNRLVGPMYECKLELLPWQWNMNSPALEGRAVSALRAQTDSPPLPFSFDLIGRPPWRGAFTPRFRLTFADASGRRWQRHPDTKVKRAKKSKDAPGSS